MSTHATGRTFADRAARWLPKLAIAPGFALILYFVYGFIWWTGRVSTTSSKMLPVDDWAGFRAYARLFQMDRWDVAFSNMFVFGGLFILISVILGGFLAILLDQRIRAEGFIRTVYLYPMAISFIVTGTAWKWILNPSLGLEKTFHDWGWESFEFNWLVSNEMSLYTLVIAAVWQASGFVMALFLAGLRSVDDEILKAAALDGAGPVQTYTRIVLPAMRATVMSAVVILAHLAIKTFDLVVALTGGGPGYASILPANFMYEMTFRRNEIAVGAASAMIMLASVAAIMIPYLYSELREAKR